MWIEWMNKKNLYQETVGDKKHLEKEKLTYMAPTVHFPFPFPRVIQLSLLPK